jgi:hypothetical protein
VILLQAVHKLTSEMANANTVDAARVVRRRKNKVSETHLSNAEEALELRSVDDLAFDRAKEDAMMNIVLKLVPIFEDMNAVGILTGALPFLALALVK